MEMLPPSANRDCVVMLLLPFMVRSLVTMFTFPASALAVPRLLAETAAPSRRVAGGAGMLISPPPEKGPRTPPAAVGVYPPAFFDVDLIRAQENISRLPVAERRC